MCLHENGNYVGESNIYHCADCDKFVHKEKVKSK